MTFVTTSEWRQCTTQLVWPPRCSSPQRWENNMMFAYDIFYSNLYQVSEYIFWGNLNSEIMKCSIFRWQVSNCRSVWSAGGKDLKTCKQLWDQKSQNLVCHSFGRLWGSSTFSEIDILMFPYPYNLSSLSGGANVGGLPISCQCRSSQVFHPII